VESHYDRFPAAAGRYDALHANRTADVAFYVAEARAGGGPALEVGCGTGRVTLAIAAAGTAVVGLDGSAAMLAVAREKVGRAAPGVRGRVRLLCADMRRYAFRTRFARVLLPYRVFMALETEADQHAALAAARDALAEDGRLVFDVVEPGERLRAALDGELVPLSPTGREIERPDGGREVERFTYRYDPATRIVETTFVYERESAAGAVVERAFEPQRSRYSFPDEIEHLLAGAGFEVVALRRGWEWESHGARGSDLVWIARKESA
jgi:SAM-dependent methyltransferase